MSSVYYSFKSVTATLLIVSAFEFVFQIFLFQNVHSSLHIAFDFVPENGSRPFSPTPAAAVVNGGMASPRPAQGLRSHFRRKSPELRAKVEAILHPPPSSLVTDLL